MKCLNATKPKYNHLLLATTILTIFLHRKHIDYTQKVFCEWLEGIPTHSWEEDF